MQREPVGGCGLHDMPARAAVRTAFDVDALHAAHELRCALVRGRLRSGRRQCRARGGQRTCLVRRGEGAAVAGALEAQRQHVLQEAADEPRRLPQKTSAQKR